MGIMNRDILIQCVKDELNAGITNIELSDAIIGRNIDRAVAISSDFYNYTEFKTLTVNPTASSGGWVNLSELDEDGGIPVVVAVYPTKNVLSIDAALLGLGSVFISTTSQLNPQLNAYSNMLHKLSNLESILGRNSHIVNDKLFLDHYFADVTVEYIPQIVKIENINEGNWIRFIIEYSAALCKRQLASSRGKFVVESNPATTNAAELLEQANTTIERLEEELQNKGFLYTSR